jgi:ribonuclease BN (tRNA processing enzyme)
MTLEILGCYGNIIGEYRATAFLINDSVLLDAGTVTEVLDDEKLKKIKHVLISHTHIDHLKGLFPLVDELVMMGSYSFELISTPDILQNITDNLFNDLIWPDFTAIPSERRAIMKLREIQIGTPSLVGTLRVQPIPVSHTVTCVGYLITEDSHGFIYTADTGLTDRIWEIARDEPNIDFIIADVSFPSRLEKLAHISGHMTPSMLIHSLERYGLDDTPIYITHMKPIFRQEILSELSSLNHPNIRALEQGIKVVLERKTLSFAGSSNHFPKQSSL